MKLLTVGSEFEFKILLRQHHKNLTKKLNSSDEEKFIDYSDASAESGEEDGEKRGTEGKEEKTHGLPDRASVSSRDRNKLSESFKSSHFHRINLAAQLRRVSKSCSKF